MISKPGSRLLVEHDLVRKPVTTFRDHALRLLVAERLDWIEPSGFARRIIAKENADGGGKQKAAGDGRKQISARASPPSAEIPTEVAIPITMPASPPLTLRNIASARNCSSTCRRRAPIAMRSPISRVRSVTDTSRMFMMPMPPTMQRYRGDGRKQQRHDPARAFRGLDELAEVADVEIVDVAGLDAVAPLSVSVT